MRIMRAVQTRIAEKLAPITRAPREVKFLVISGGIIISFLLFLTLFAEFVAPYNAYQRLFPEMLPPSGVNLMGTDALGRDVLSRVLVGTRNSLTVAFLAVSISLLVGMSLGALSGYWAGKVDRVLLLVMDALYAFPSMITGVIVSVMLGPGLVNTSLAIVVPLIGPYYRIVRSITLSIKQMTFIEAERSLGASKLYIVSRHIAPFFASNLFVLISMSAARAILTVASLGFLGLGVPPPTAEWGTDLNMGRMFIPRGVWWTTVFPGIFIFLAVMGFNLLSEGLNEVYRVEKHLYYR